MYKYIYFLLVVNISMFSQRKNYSLFKGDSFKAMTITNSYENKICDLEDKKRIALLPNRKTSEIIKDYLFYDKLEETKQENIINKIKLQYYFSNNKEIYVKYNDSLSPKSNIICYSYIKKEVIKGDASYVYVIKNLRLSFFWEFYNSFDDLKFSEINKLKPLVKDANGVLNIEKLAQVIKENEASLSKYLDN